MQSYVSSSKKGKLVTLAMASVLQLSGPQDAICAPNALGLMLTE